MSTYLVELRKKLESFTKEEVIDFTIGFCENLQKFTEEMVADYKQKFGGEELI